MNTNILIDQRVILNSRYSVVVKVLKVPSNKKHPDGIKARFLLLDNEAGKARLLIDNHAPFGYHVHTELPENHEARIPLDASDYRVALNFFWKEVERILRNENE